MTASENLNITKDDCWKVIDSFFNEKGVISQQLDSYDEFLCENVPRIIETNPPIEIIYKKNISPEICEINSKKKDTQTIKKKIYEVQTHKFIFKKCLIGSPIINEFRGGLTNITPNIARLRNLTYDVGIYTTINYIYKKEIVDYSNPNNVETKVEETFSKDENIKLCNVPLMLNTKYCVLYKKTEKERIDLGECSLDVGGYFIVNGSEKVLVAQERMATNQVYVFLNKLNNYVCEIRSIQEGVLKSANMILIKHVNSPKTSSLTTEKILRIQIPFIKKDIPIIILFRALGIIKDEHILDLIEYQILDDKIKKQFLKIINPCFEESFIISKQEDALEYIGKRYVQIIETREERIKVCKEVLEKEFLSHISIKNDTEKDKSNNFKLKGYFLGYMVNRLCMTILGYRDLDDRDSFGNKRLDLAGNLLGNLFKISFSKMCKDFKIICEKSLNGNKNINLKLYLRGADISKDLKYALATGNWGSSRQRTTRTGVAQVLNRLSYSATLSHLKRVNAPISKDGKMAKPRQLHPTSFSLLCCLTGDSLILMSDGSLKRIDQIKNNDIVVTVNPKTLKQELSPIYNWFKLNPKRILKIKITNGRKIKCTDDHPLLVYNKKTKSQDWINAGELKINDYLIIKNIESLPNTNLISLRDDLAAINVYSIEEIPVEPVYDFTTRSNNHSFIANGIVVSNCSETPEGHACGLIKNLSLLTHISLSYSSEVIEKCLELFDIIKLTSINIDSVEDCNKLKNSGKIFINGNWVGIAEDLDEIYNSVLNLRRNGTLRYDITIRKNNSNELNIESDIGRCCGPKIVLEKTKDGIQPKLTKEHIVGLLNNEISWSHLVRNGIIEYLDVYEQSEMLIAMSLSDVYNNMFKMDYTHLEIHPSLMFSICTSIIPFSNCNQAPRITYSAAQSKQAMGMYTTNHKLRMDTLGHILFYPQKPFIQTKQSKYLNYDEVPSGQNLIVAIANYGGLTKWPMSHEKMWQVIRWMAMISNCWKIL